ncbi:MULTISPECIES: 2-isopropylmalate synthase [unclassified Devosia]|uniref:2-isopropylmalate synthase n=1 Tax=unclassified Devosia TaxID=196773 RepID=UPI00145C77C6|nr:MULTISPECIES: 2-isopropylmalate synthase [unclassified Devosia]MBJ6986558.1 2-isopropylmalate synthase [Devosia sp. MC521]QMW61603.1 2-isopropylmalate synthase [Devosia sp. MC521]
MTAATNSNKERVFIFDTTLRDGEQSPGATMTLEEKLQVAETLDEMGVDIIEAGFPIASNGDFEAVVAVAKHVKNARVAGLARAITADIDRAAEAVRHANAGRIHTFVSTSPIHLAHQMKKTEDEVIEIIARTVAQARNLIDDVEWSAMDATRTPIEFLMRCVDTAIRAGATTINLPDTVGYAVPEEHFRMFKTVIEGVPNSDKAIFSVHCHNDLGMAVANSLAGVAGGARQIECTINGLGERAGNAALEEVVMALRTRGDAMPFYSEIETTHLSRASRIVAAAANFPVQYNKAIVGKNAFAHESGIHQDGMLKNAETYEIMTPASVGIKETTLVMGKHSGRAAFKDKLKELGYELGDNAFQEAFQRFKDLADRKKHVYDADLVALVDDEVGSAGDRIKLVDLEVISKTGGIHKCNLTVTIEGEEKSVTYEGTGSVDAIFNAIKLAADANPHLVLYAVDGVTGGTDAQASAHVRLEMNGRIASGNAAEPDTLVASARAYLNALNRVVIERGAAAQGALAG